MHRTRRGGQNGRQSSGMTGALAPERRVDTDAPDLELTLPARAENVAVVRHAFGGFGDALDVPDQTLADVKLAVTEACTNVVVHAYPGGEGPMKLRATVLDGMLRVVVQRRGPRDPPARRQPGPRPRPAADRDARGVARARDRRQRGDRGADVFRLGTGALDDRGAR